VSAAAGTQFQLKSNVNVCQKWQIVNGFRGAQSEIRKTSTGSSIFEMRWWSNRMSQHWKLLTILILALGLTAIGSSPALASGQQGGGQVCFGDSLVIASGRTVDSLLGFGCNVTIENGATVLGDIVDFGGNVAVAGAVQGNVIAFGGNVAIAESGTVFGSVTALGGNVSTAPGAVVQGDVNQNRRRMIQPFAFAAPFAGFNGWGFDILGGIVTALAFAALGALVVIFAPNATQRVSDAALAKPLNTAGVGCLTLILLPILGILLVNTLIGIPVAFILAIAAAAAWIFGGIGIGLLAGEKILSAFKARNVIPVAAVILGILVLMVVGQVPILGWLISCIVGLVGLGAVVLTRFGTRPYPLPPTMAMTPAMAVAGASVPGTYNPSTVDVAAWEAKARTAQAAEPQAAEPQSAEPQATDVPAPPTGEPAADLPPPAEPKSETPPGESEEPKPNA
jgi:hypothetical protein